MVSALHAPRMGVSTGNSTRVGEQLHEQLAIKSMQIDSNIGPIQAESAQRRPSSHAGADLVLLDENPLEDISHTRCISGVMVRGDWMPTEEVEQVLAGLKSEYDEDRTMLQQQSAGPSSR